MKWPNYDNQGTKNVKIIEKYYSYKKYVVDNGNKEQGQFLKNQQSRAIRLYGYTALQSVDIVRTPVTKYSKLNTKIKKLRWLVHL